MNPQPVSPTDQAETAAPSPWDGQADPYFQPMDPAREWSLLERWRFGRDTASGQELARAYMKLADSTARAAFKSPLDLSERQSRAVCKLTHVFEVFASPASDFEPQGSLARVHNYVRTAMRNAIMDGDRDRWHGETRRGDNPYRGLSVSPESEQVAARREIMALMSEAGLSPQEEKAVNDQMDGLNQKDTIRALGVSKPTGSRLVARAMEKLKAAYRRQR